MYKKLKFLVTIKFLEILLGNHSKKKKNRQNVLNRGLLNATVKIYILTPFGP
jgi:hypothetical protein